MSAQQNTQAPAAPTNTAASGAVETMLNKLMPIDPVPHAAPRFVTNAIQLSVPIYYAVNASERQMKSLMSVMTLCGKSTDTSPVNWQTWVLTWSCLVFSELVGAIRDSNFADYRLVPFTVEFMDECVNSILAQGTTATAGDRFLTMPPGLPSTTTTPMTASVAGAASSPEGLYAYYAMLVFIMGKSITPDTVTAIGSKRPDALIRKRKLFKSEYILTGDGRVAQENYGKVQSGWVRSNGPRVIIVKHLAALYASPNHPESLDAVVVNMDMLKNSGQSYLFYIYELLVACEWCLAIPALAAEYRHFSRMVNVLTRENVHIQPFYKLMMQDNTKLIRRRDVENLVAVSIFYAGQTRPSMKQYRVSPEARPVLQEFIRMARDRGMTLREITDQSTIEATTI